jgi:alkanesulfonate monooxygenase SsuD/methylene tetrahydromethanopterin reductase-like flavin-dependent oxidoreductase (luciferase family)
VSTIDVLSHGRVVLGVGTGWLPEELAAAGADHARRGDQTDQALKLLRQAFEHGEVDGLTLLPTPVQRPGPPIWVGGSGPRPMRRVVEHGDVWDAPDPDPTNLAAGKARLHEACERAGRDPQTIGIAVRSLSPRALTSDILDRYRELGVADLGIRLPVGTFRDPGRTSDELAAAHETVTAR